jgi:small-conductance mechanosensitive channel
MKDLIVSGVKAAPAIYIPVLYFLWISVFLILKKIFFNRIRKFTDRTVVKIDDVFVHAMDLPLLLMIFASGVFVLDNIFEFSAGSELLAFVDIAFKVTTIIAVILFVDRLFRGLIDVYSSKIPILKDSGGVMRMVVRVVVLGLGGLILLDSFGVSITPVLASLGIGSLALALALQPTLENFFSGIEILIDKPVIVGQFVKLESGEEGCVEKIGWRSTRVRVLPNNIIVVPNKALAGSRILDYCYPKNEMSVLVQMGVHYDSDLEQVEKVTLDAAKEVLSPPEYDLGKFEPFLRYHTFNDSSIDFTVVLRAKKLVDGYRIKHEFIKLLKKRYDENGIVIPYPMRTLDWNDGSSPLKITDIK